MASGVNKVILIGHAGRDAELRFTASGTSVAKFSLATTETWGKGEDRKSNTEWHNIVCWGNLANICGKYVTKGKLLYIEGKIKTQKWEDKDGNKRSNIDIVANVVNLLGSKNDDYSQNSGYGNAATDRYVDEQVAAEATEYVDDGLLAEDDDIPF